MRLHSKTRLHCAFPSNQVHQAQCRRPSWQISRPSCTIDASHSPANALHATGSCRDSISQQPGVPALLSGVRSIARACNPLLLHIQTLSTQYSADLNTPGVSRHNMALAVTESLLGMHIVLCKEAQLFSGGRVSVP